MSQQRKEECRALHAVLNNDARYRELKKESRNALVVALEEGINDTAVDRATEQYIPTFWDDIGFVELYNSIAYRVKSNLDPLSTVNRESGTEASISLTRLLDGSLLPQQVARLTPEQLNPHINQCYYEQLAVRSNQQQESKYSEMYECPNCHIKKSTSRIGLTRGLDEPYTLALHCLNCGHDWYIHG